MVNVNFSLSFVSHPNKYQSWGRDHGNLWFIASQLRVQVTIWRGSSAMKFNPLICGIWHSPNIWCQNRIKFVGHPICVYLKLKNCLVVLKDSPCVPVTWSIFLFVSHKSHCVQIMGIGPHLAGRWKSHGFSRVAAGTWGIFSSYSGDVHSKL